MKTFKRGDLVYYDNSVCKVTLAQGDQHPQRLVLKRQNYRRKDGRTVTIPQDSGSIVGVPSTQVKPVEA